jgi:hypothetical protein
LENPPVDTQAMPPELTQSAMAKDRSGSGGPAAGGTRSAGPLLDPSWLFLLAGLGLLGATILIPAAEDLREARWLRDRAQRRETHRKSRLERYEGYLDAIESRDPTLLESLTASQLNQIPVGMALLAEPVDAHVKSASVFPALEPEPLVLPELRAPESALSRLATGEHSRLWMIAGGAACVLVGLLPAVRGGELAAAKRPRGA